MLILLLMSECFIFKYLLNINDSSYIYKIGMNRNRMLYYYCVLSFSSYFNHSMNGLITQV